MKESDLKYFKELLIERKNQLLKNIENNKKEINELKELEVKDEADHASINADSIVEEAIASQQAKELKDIDYALFKIDSGAYGICEMCEEPIGNERLKVKPQAKYCIVCREIAEKSSNKG